MRNYSLFSLVAAAILLVGMLVGAPAVQANPGQASQSELGMLVPMPDLRTPDQVRWWERLRNRQVAKRKMRTAKTEAKRESREREEAAVVYHAQDPSMALAHVSSQSGTAASYGNVEAPSTLNGGTLCPVNGSSRYYRNGQMLYQGNGDSGSSSRSTNQSSGPRRK